jgi:hypothetical protein
MKLPVVVMVVVSLALVACGGGGGDSTPIYVTQILSDPVYDGDIAQDPVSGTYTVTQGYSKESVFAGIDPVTFEEFRAFLDFPLSGPGGVPLNAGIASATLDIFIDDIQPTTGTIPIRIDLVSFQPPWLQESDFSLTVQPALAIITIPIYQADYRQHVVIDVTSLMREAQRWGLPDFQVRILEDRVAPGLIEINDTTVPADRRFLAPLLEVTYY